MGYILNEKHNIEVELRRESCYVREVLDDDGEIHVIAYSPNSDGTVTLELSYDFMKRLLRFIDGSKDFHEKLLEAEQKRLTK